MSSLLARIYRGFAAYRRVSWRVPFLWPVLPLLYLPPVTTLATRVYRRVADHRLCHVGDGLPAGREEPRASVRSGWTTAPTLVGAVILVAMVSAIPGQQTNAWPVALYPTFAGLHQPSSDTLVVVRRGLRRAKDRGVEVLFPVDADRPLRGPRQADGRTRQQRAGWPRPRAGHGGNTRLPAVAGTVGRLLLLQRPGSRRRRGT